jgi:hypothetical protein
LTPAVAVAVAGLGVFHGLNPAMGWLFAVALGQQRRASPVPAGSGPPGPAAGAVGAVGAVGAGRPAVAGRPAAAGRPAVGGPAGRAGVAGWRSRLAVLWALPPIAAGHLASVAAVAVAFAATASALASRAAAVGGGVLLVGLGLWRLLSARHFRWVGMRLSGWELGTWSFLMSSVHGAGLMLVPVLAHHPALPAGSSVPTALAAAGLHTAAMLATAGAVALIVTEILGLSVLRHAWLNVDRIWAVALLAAGATTLLAS